MTVLVACPAAPRKEYAFPFWEEATRPYERLIAVEEADAGWAATLGVPFVTYQPPDTPRRVGRHAMYGPRFNVAWGALLDAATQDYVLSWDSDVIPEEGALEVMQNAYTGGFLRAGVPWRSEYSRPGKGYEMAFTYASLEVWRDALAACGERTLYGAVGDPDLFPHTDIDTLSFQHLDSPMEVRS